MRWLLCLLLYLPIQVLTYLITPLLPLFATTRVGWCNNHSFEAFSIRLPLKLAWFDTPDNALSGDSNWLASHAETTYWDMVAWLYRNSLYGFKWSVLAALMESEKVTRIGPAVIDYHTKQYGTQRYTMGKYWQYKSVKPFMGRILVLNFGWLLDDVSQKKALFMFSPRIK